MMNFIPSYQTRTDAQQQYRGERGHCRTFNSAEEEARFVQEAQRLSSLCAKLSKSARAALFGPDHYKDVIDAHELSRSIWELGWNDHVNFCSSCCYTDGLTAKKSNDYIVRQLISDRKIYMEIRDFVSWKEDQTVRRSYAQQCEEQRHWEELIVGFDLELPSGG